MITSDDFCDLLTSVKVGPYFLGIFFIIFQGHLLTEKVRKVLKDFVQETQGETVTYAYSTAFQNLLTDIETAKKVKSINENRRLCLIGLSPSLWRIKDKRDIKGRLPEVWNDHVKDEPTPGLYLTPKHCCCDISG